MLQYGFTARGLDPCAFALIGLIYVVYQGLPGEGSMCNTICPVPGARGESAVWGGRAGRDAFRAVNNIIRVTVE